MATPAGERRVVSVLLADIVGSTTIAEELGAERSKFLFDEVVLLLAGEIKRFGGKSDAVEAFRVAGEREAEELAVLDEVLGDLVERGELLHPTDERRGKPLRRFALACDSECLSRVGPPFQLQRAQRLELEHSLDPARSCTSVAYPASASWIRSAARTARSASSSCAFGTPNSA